MINGLMAEAQRGFAVLDDVDEGTIQRFIEWAYKGYYTGAEFHQEIKRSPSPLPRTEDNKCEPIESLPEPEQVFLDEEAEAIPIDDSLFAEVFEEPRLPPMPSSTVQPDFPERGGFKPFKKDKHKAKNKRELKESFLKHDYKVRRGMITLPSTRGNLGPSENYTEVFLSHARLYVFADMYDIQVLKTLALEELHSTLSNYTLYRSRAEDIIALLRYGYANTSCEGNGADLRKLLTDYMGFEMSTLMKDTKFRDVTIEDGGELLGDFMKMVTIRID